MDWFSLHLLLLYIQKVISFSGILIIFSGIILAIYQYLSYLLRGQLVSQSAKINSIRLNLGRILVLGLEFIVAADLIGTTTTPDYYTVGILASIVLIRTLLSYTLSRELMTLSEKK